MKRITYLSIIIAVIALSLIPHHPTRADGIPVTGPVKYFDLFHGAGSATSTSHPHVRFTDQVTSPIPVTVGWWVSARGQERLVTTTVPNAAGCYTFTLDCPEPQGIDAYLIRIDVPPGYAVRTSCSNDHCAPPREGTIAYAPGLCYLEELPGNDFTVIAISSHHVYLPIVTR